MPFFENLVDVIDYEHSECDEHSAYIACYSLKKIRELDFFPEHDRLRLKGIKEDDTRPYFIDNHFIVSKRFKDILIANQITGIEFSRERCFDDLHPELGKHWDELKSHYLAYYHKAESQCSFIFNVDYAYWKVCCDIVLGVVRRAVIGEELDVQQAKEQSSEIIAELTEEEYIKNNLRKLFEYYDDTIYTGPYVEGEIRQGYGAVGVPAKEVIEVLSGKVPVKDGSGIMIFLPLPKQMQFKLEKLNQAAAEISKVVSKAVLKQKTATPEYIFSKYRKIKNRLVDGDEKRLQGNEREQQCQRVKDYAREIIEDYEQQQLRECDGWLDNLIIKEANCRWRGEKVDLEMEQLRRQAQWSKNHFYILAPE